MLRIPRSLPSSVLIGLFLAVTAGSAFATHNYVIANNNASFNNTITIYELSGNTLGASLVSVTTLSTGGAGISGGYPANPTAVTSQFSAPGGCVFVGDAGSGDIAVMKPINQSPHLQLVGNFHSIDGDAATAGGLGIVVSGDYIYASYTGNGSNIPPAIEQWEDSTGQCFLAYAGSRLVTAGIDGGPINSMAETPNFNHEALVVGYTDGSVGSYSLGATFFLIDQEMLAGSGVGSGAYASGVAISRDGKWAIFADASASNTTQVDVAPLTPRGSLGPTTTYGGDGSLGSGLNSTSIALSPDNRFIYIVDSGSGQVTTLSFDTTTGIVTFPNNCLTDLKGYNTNWATASQVAVVGDAGTGQALYISEGFLTGDSYIALLAVNSTTGCATELPRSPFVDSNGGSLQSIAAFTF